MKLLKQFQAGRWFIFWTMDEGKSYTALDPSDMRYLKGPDPQELIKRLVGGEGDVAPDEVAPKPKKRAKRG